jgi:hypothetical protein
VKEERIGEKGEVKEKGKVKREKEKNKARRERRREKAEGRREKAEHSGTGLICEMVLVKKLKLEASGHECRKK